MLEKFEIYFEPLQKNKNKMKLHFLFSTFPMFLDPMFWQNFCLALVSIFVVLQLLRYFVYFILFGFSADTLEDHINKVEKLQKNFDDRSYLLKIFFLHGKAGRICEKILRDTIPLMILNSIKKKDDFSIVGGDFITNMEYLHKTVHNVYEGPKLGAMLCEGILSAFTLYENSTEYEVAVQKIEQKYSLCNNDKHSEESLARAYNCLKVLLLCTGNRAPGTLKNLVDMTALCHDTVRIIRYAKKWEQEPEGRNLRSIEELRMGMFHSELRNPINKFIAEAEKMQVKAEDIAVALPKEIGVLLKKAS